jgi:hypothetical protein
MSPAQRGGPPSPPLKGIPPSPPPAESTRASQGRPPNPGWLPWCQIGCLRWRNLHVATRAPGQTLTAPRFLVFDGGHGAPVGVANGRLVLAMRYCAAMRTPRPTPDRSTVSSLRRRSFCAGRRCKRTRGSCDAVLGGICAHARAATPPTCVIVASVLLTTIAHAPARADTMPRGLHASAWLARDMVAHTARTTCAACAACALLPRHAPTCLSGAMHS